MARLEYEQGDARWALTTSSPMDRVFRIQELSYDAESFLMKLEDALGYLRNRRTTWLDVRQQHVDAKSDPHHVAICDSGIAMFEAAISWIVTALPGDYFEGEFLKSYLITCINGPVPTPPSERS